MKMTLFRSHIIGTWFHSNVFGGKIFGESKILFTHRFTIKLDIFRLVSWEKQRKVVGGVDWKTFFFG